MSTTQRSVTGANAFPHRAEIHDSAVAQRSLF
jgi:hypothetical protein